MKHLLTILPYALIVLAIVIIVRALDTQAAEATRGGYYD